MIKNWCIIVCLFVVTAVRASKKKGIAGYSGSYKCDDFKVLNNMSWTYDWHLDLSQLYTKHMNDINCPASTYEQYLPEYVPMVMTLSSTPGGQKYLNHTANIPPYAKYVLGFNEPNKASHANMSAREAAEKWAEIERHSHGVPLVSPAPSGHNTHWLDSFFHYCNACRIDYVAAHSYRCNADETMSFLHKLYRRYGKKVWLTEFSCPHTNDSNVQLRLMKDLLPRLEAADYVFRYSWFQARFQENGKSEFMTTSAALFWQNSSTLTPLGHFYNEFQGNSNSPHVVG